jgi:hypothetical protein
MFGVLALVPVSQTQSSGLPWYLWLLLLVIVIVVAILFQRRSGAKNAPPARVETPAPVRTVEAPPLPDAAAEAPAAGAETLSEVTAAVGETAAEAPAIEAAAKAAVEAPVAEVAAAVAAAKPPVRAWKSSTWRTREWQPKPPAWYPKWKYRRPAGS